MADRARRIPLVGDLPRVVAAAVVASVGLLSGPASAEGFFDLLFGNHQQAAAPAPARKRVSIDVAAPRHPTAATPAPRVGGSGHAVAFCVRLCDGRFFPIQRYNAATPVQICNAFCPASKTKVFSGGTIDTAVAADGARYAGLDNAYVYRARLVPGCTCNGQNQFGLAAVDINSDPTLRPGDIVSTPAGPTTIGGSSLKHRATRTAAIATPVVLRSNTEGPAKEITLSSAHVPN